MCVCVRVCVCACVCVFVAVCVLKTPHLALTSPSPPTVSFFVVTLNEFGLATAAFSLRADSTEKAQNFRKQVERAQVKCQPPRTTNTPLLTLLYCCSVCTQGALVRVVPAVPACATVLSS